MRGDRLWIAGRIGILLCFGIVPIVRICSRANNPPPAYDEFGYVRYCSRKFDQCMAKTNLGCAVRWLDKGNMEFFRVTGQRISNDSK